MKNLLIFIGGMVATLFLLSAFPEYRSMLGWSDEVGNSQEVVLSEAVPEPEPVPEPQEEEAESAKLMNGVMLFDAPEDCVSRGPFRVMQVLESGDALAVEIEVLPGCRVVLDRDLVVLFLSHGEKHFYDDQQIKASAGKCFKQIGLYKYREWRDIKTVPVVEVL